MCLKVTIAEKVAYNAPPYGNGLTFRIGLKPYFIANRTTLVREKNARLLLFLYFSGGVSYTF